jgi:hypothetical protein
MQLRRLGYRAAFYKIVAKLEGLLKAAMQQERNNYSA